MDGPIGFAPFSLLHAAAVAACAAIIVGACALGRGWRGTSRERTLRRSIGAAGLCFFLVHNAYWLSPGVYTLERSLPLHICDLAGVIAPLTLLAPTRIGRALTYFWGFVLGLQGFIQPVIHEGPETFVFWGFFAAHTINVGCACYDIAVAGYRPSLRDVGIALAASLVYLAVILPFNIAAGLNYGYVGKTLAAQPTLLDVLGPWPLRLVWMFALLAAAFLIAWAPWRLVQGRAV